MSTRPSRSSSIPSPSPSSRMEEHRPIRPVTTVRPPHRSSSLSLSLAQRAARDEYRTALASSSESSGSPAARNPVSRSSTTRPGPITIGSRAVANINDNARRPSSSPSRPRPTPSSRPPLSRPHVTSATATTTAFASSAAVPPSTHFPRPTYLDHSALRHIIHTDLPPLSTTSPGLALAAPPFAKPLSAASLRDSDEDSEASAREREGSVAARARLAASQHLSGEAVRLPARWLEHSQQLSLSPDGLGLKYEGPSHTSEKEASAARADLPAPPACGVYYFEVKIVDKGVKGHVSIGFAGPQFNLNRLPGWERSSWGYHGDDGRSFAAQQEGSIYGPKFTTGDVIGCGIDFAQNCAFYTKNGQHLGTVFNGIDATGGQLYPAIGLRTPGEEIRANFGHSKFEFNIDAYVLYVRDNIWTRILTTRLNWEVDRSKNILHLAKETEEQKRERESGVVSARMDDASIAKTGQSGGGVNSGDLATPLNEIILAYLSHHGYAKSARAFKAQYDRTGLSAQLEVEPAPQSAAPTASANAEDPVMMDISNYTSFPLTATARPQANLLGPKDVLADTEARRRIMDAVIRGDIEAALQETKDRYPTVLKERTSGNDPTSALDALIVVKLRCRKFIDMLLEAAGAESGERKENADSDDGMQETIRESEDEDSEAMDVDVELSFPSEVPMSLKAKGKQPATNNISGTVDMTAGTAAALAFGQELQAAYGSDPRSAVQEIFKRAFSLLAYANPRDHRQANEILGVATQVRTEMAVELNSLILASQERPDIPVLERMYRQASAIVTQLGRLGVGSAAYADVEREFRLVAP